MKRPIQPEKGERRRGGECSAGNLLFGNLSLALIVFLFAFTTPNGILAQTDAQVEMAKTLSELQEEQQALMKKVDLHSRVMDGLSEKVNGLGQEAMRSEQERKNANQERAELLAAIDAVRIEMKNVRQEVESSSQKTRELIDEQAGLRASIEASASKVNSAIIIAIIGALLAIIIAVLAARSIVKKNRMNWYALVRDTLSDKEAA